MTDDQFFDLPPPRNATHAIAVVRERMRSTRRMAVFFCTAGTLILLALFTHEAMGGEEVPRAAARALCFACCPTGTFCIPALLFFFMQRRDLYALVRDGEFIEGTVTSSKIDRFVLFRRRAFEVLVVDFAIGGTTYRARVRLLVPAEATPRYAAGDRCPLLAVRERPSKVAVRHGPDLVVGRAGNLNREH